MQFIDHIYVRTREGKFIHALYRRDHPTKAHFGAFLMCQEEWVTVHVANVNEMKFPVCAICDAVACEKEGLNDGVTEQLNLLSEWLEG